MCRIKDEEISEATLTSQVYSEGSYFGSMRYIWDKMLDPQSFIFGITIGQQLTVTIIAQGFIRSLDMTFRFNRHPYSHVGST